MIRQVAGGSPFPQIGTSFPHEENLRNVRVNGRHWWEIPTPSPPIHMNQRGLTSWFPGSIYRPPVNRVLYQQLLHDIRDTPKTVEEVGHDILITNGYVEQADGWYLL